LGLQVVITAPPAAWDDPLTIVFLIDASLIPEDQDENTIEIFKDGELVPACTGASGTASPDPCVSKREKTDGDVRITVLTSTASVWNFGVSAQATPTPTPATAAAGIAVGPTTGAPSGLPDTGSSPAAATGSPLWALGIAVALLALGGLALTAARRRER
jgi:hypothetical protein